MDCLAADGQRAELLGRILSLPLPAIAHGLKFWIPTAGGDDV